MGLSLKDFNLISTLIVIILAVVKECQVAAAVKFVCTYEAPTGVYFFLAVLREDFAQHAKTDLKQLKRRLAFARRKIPLVWCDCACKLKRFMTAKRKKKSKLARAMANLHVAIDQFHVCRSPGFSFTVPHTGWGFFSARVALENSKRRVSN